MIFAIRASGVALASEWLSVAGSFLVLLVALIALVVMGLLWNAADRRNDS